MKWFGRLILAGAVLTVSGAQLAAQSYVGGVEAPAFLADFGGSIAISEGQIIVGEGGNTIRPGMVYVHERSGDGWERTAELTGSEATMGDGFGSALVVVGDQMMIAGDRGVHLFARSDGAWREIGMLDAPGDPETTGFGAALAGSGDVAIVGAPGIDDGAGAVYIYRRSGSGWTLASTLTNRNPASGERFGSSVAFDGDMALIGAPGAGEQAGSVLAYRIGSGDPEMLGALPAGGMEEGDRFGATVAITDGLALASAPASAGTGAVLAFRWSSEDERWVSLGRWTAFDGRPQQGRLPGTSFGLDMAVVDGAVWVGSNTGAYVFDVDSDYGIVSVSKEDGDGIGGGFGSTVVAGGGIVAVAAPRADSGVGQVLVFENGTHTATLGSDPEEFDRVVGGEVSCTGSQASAWECADVDLASYLPISELSGDGTHGIRTNDNWGWEDPDTGDKYALVGMTDRASFVNITDPTNPRVVGILMMTEGANGSAWRDLKTFGNHVFIVSDGAGDHGMQIFDLTRLRDHTSGDPVFFEADAHYDRVASAHNVVLNTEIGHAYIVGARGGGETCGGGLHIVDVNDPTNPEFAGCFADDQTGRAGTGYSHDAQCTVYRGPDEEWYGRAICLGSNETALSIADVTDPANPVKISSATYPDVAYSHQGWLSEDHRWFYMNDELDEIGGLTEYTRTLVWDLEDLDDPVLVNQHMGTTPASDHNLYVAGNLMFQSNYRAGLRILDISDPANPVEVAYFDTVPYGDNSAGTSGAWSNYPFFGDGTLIQTGGSEGLFVLRPTILNTIF
jgi:choice-of-anchor B domain-containing protein